MNDLDFRTRARMKMAANWRRIAAKHPSRKKMALAMAKDVERRARKEAKQ